MVQYLAGSTHTLGPISSRGVCGGGRGRGWQWQFSVLLADQHWYVVWWLYILPVQGEHLPVKTGIYIYWSSGGSGHGVNSKDILDYESCQLAGHTKQTNIIHAHCVMIKAHLKAPLLKCGSFFFLEYRGLIYIYTSVNKCMKSLPV